MNKNNKEIKAPLVKISIYGNVFCEYGFFKMTQVYFNKRDYPIKTKYIFPVPTDSVIKDISVFKKNKKIVGSKILSKNDLKKTKRSKTTSKIKAILTYISKDLCILSLDEIPHQSLIKVSVEYYKELFLDENKLCIKIPLTLNKSYSRVNVSFLETENVSEETYESELNIEINNIMEVFNIFSPSHDIIVNRFKTYSLINFEEGKASADKDLEIIVSYKENKINKVICVKNPNFGIGYCSVYAEI